MQKERLSVKEASEILGMNVNAIRVQMMNGQLPIGEVIKDGRERYTYLIFRPRLERYLKGEL